MRSVVITGLGLASPLGTTEGEISRRLETLDHGFSPWHPVPELENPPVSVAAAVPGFDLSARRPMAWQFPEGYRPPSNMLRSLPASGVFAHFAMEAALADAGLGEELLSSEQTGLFTAHSGSSELMHRHLGELADSHWSRVNPMALLRCAPGLLNWHFAAHYGIRGSVCGYLSACSSASHAIGHAMDEIRLGRQDRIIVLAGEDLAWETFLPFHGLAALSTATDPNQACLPFDRERRGFVPGSGGACLVLESEEAAAGRGAKVRAKLLGWGQASDGYHPVHPEPSGRGVLSAARRALAEARVEIDQLDGINAHAPGTHAGDAAEAKALLALLGPRESGGPRPPVSSTKALTGHGLCLAGLHETALCVLALEGGFVPGQAGYEHPDEVTGDLNIPTQSVHSKPQTMLKLTSGFGGTNVGIVISRG